MTESVDRGSERNQSDDESVDRESDADGDVDHGGDENDERRQGGSNESRGFELFEYYPEWDAPVTGAIPTIENQEAHRGFVSAVDPDVLVVPFTHARPIANGGESVADWLPEGVDRESVTVITTMTVSDDDLARISWEKEVDVIGQFRPDYHVPADYPVYGDDPPDQRLENCMQCAVGTEWVSDRLPDSVGVIPLIKGTTPRERRVCERQARHLGAEIIAVYGGQYFGAGGGGGRSRLIEDLEAINRETDCMPTLVIGSLSPWVLKETPKNVVAGAGLRAWREEVRPRSSTPAEMRERFSQLCDDVDGALELTPDPFEDGESTGTETESTGNTDMNDTTGEL